MDAGRQVSDDAIAHLGGDGDPHFPSRGKLPGLIEIFDQFRFPAPLAFKWVADPPALQFRAERRPIYQKVLPT